MAKKNIDEKINSKRVQNKVQRKQKRADKKIEKAQNSGNLKRVEKADKKYGYNYEKSIQAGNTPDETGHWPSLDPRTGEVLKGKKHPTHFITKMVEKSMGNKIVKKDGKMFSMPKKRS